MHPDFHRYMLTLAGVYAVEAAWAALPGGIAFHGSPLEGVVLPAVLLALIWRRWRPVYILVVIAQALGVLPLLRFAGYGDAVVVAVWVVLILAQLGLLLSNPVRRTVMRSYDEQRPPAPAAAGVRS